ncbi:MAG: hypothetical protein KBS62_04450 [Oscillospiraceae bacterium]|nr:hypothetical protein [Candidatus Ruminococcus equi]
MTDGIFGDMFDFNGDGHLDYGEQTLEFMFLEELINEDEGGEDEEEFY